MTPKGRFMSEDERKAIEAYISAWGDAKASNACRSTLAEIDRLKAELAAERAKGVAFIDGLRNAYGQWECCDVRAAIRETLERAGETIDAIGDIE